MAKKQLIINPNLAQLLKYIKTKVWKSELSIYICRPLKKKKSGYA